MLFSPRVISSSLSLTYNLAQRCDIILLLCQPFASFSCILPLELSWAFPLSFSHFIASHIFPSHCSLHLIHCLSNSSLYLVAHFLPLPLSPSALLSFSNLNHFPFIFTFLYPPSPLLHRPIPWPLDSPLPSLSLYSISFTCCNTISGAACAISSPSVEPSGSWQDTAYCV